MKLILLGTTGYHPNDRRHTPCMLLPECGVMLDAGTATYRAARFLATSELLILLTHAHLDHVVGLTYLFSVVRVHPLERIVVRGPAEALAAIDEHLFSEALFPKKPPMEFQPLGALVGRASRLPETQDRSASVAHASCLPHSQDRPVSAGQAGGLPCEDLPSGGRMAYFPLEHPGGSVGYRLDWPGHSLAYVTDTTATPDADYVERIRGVDLLVHECYFSDANEDWARRTGHSWTTAVAQVARKARVERLVLTHLNPLSSDDDPIGLDAARAIFPNTQIGEDLMELEF